MLLRRDFRKRQGKTCPGIERGSLLPGEPANVMLLGGEAKFLVRHRRGKLVIAPGARQLAGEPGMARLRNGDHIEAVLAQQHPCYLINFP